jgi:hypothetical protein
VKRLLLLASVLASSVCLANPAFAHDPSEHVIHVTGTRGTYIVDQAKGSYQACLFAGGCISLGRKHLMKKLSRNFGCEDMPMLWRNGEYIYIVGWERIKVTRNGQVVFEDKYIDAMCTD